MKLSGLTTRLERTDEIRWHECQGRLLPLNRNVTGMTVYVRIRDSEFWIEEDWTENGIATDLVLAGVPKEDIVLAFHEPKMRQYTEFAVAS